MKPAKVVTAEQIKAVRVAAVQAEHAARRLLRRTYLLPRTSLEVPLSVDPDIPPAAGGQVQELLHQIDELQARAERAEHAASWLRARLRAERQRRSVAPPLDSTLLAADFTHALMQLEAPYSVAVKRVVERVLASHGMPIGVNKTNSAATRSRSSAEPATIPGWTQEQQQAIARQALAQTPDISDKFYVYQALTIVASRGRAALPDLMQASGLDSAMARRRLRLAIETLAILGALTAQNGSYTFNPDFGQLHQYSALSQSRRSP